MGTWVSFGSSYRHGEDGEACVGVVTLDDPAHRNTMSLPLVDELVAVMDRLEADTSVGAVVVTGAPPAFCAGADLGNLAAQGESGCGWCHRRSSTHGGCRCGAAIDLRRFLEAGEMSPADGGRRQRPGRGSGHEPRPRLSTFGWRACSARFDTRFLDIGLHPGGGHTFMLDRIGGPQLAAALVLFGQRLDGAAAAAHGLAWACVEDDVLVEEAVAIALRAASAPRDLAVRAKETLRAVGGLHDHADAIDLEIAAQIWSLGEPFFLERLARLRARVGVKPRPANRSAEGRPVVTDRRDTWIERA